MTQEELAEHAGISPRSISEIERGGTHIPRRDTVGLLVRALGLTGSERSAFEAMIDRRRPRSGPGSHPGSSTPGGQPGPWIGDSTGLPGVD